MRQDDFHIEMVSDARHLCALRALVRTYVGAQGFAADRTEEIVLAVDEACTNAIRHSYGGRRDGRLTLELSSRDEAVEFVLSDEGAPAPRERTTRNVESAVSADSVRPGGVGVQIIFRVFDEVEFEPGASRGNRVTMRARRIGGEAR